MISEDKIIEIFCFADDFSKLFDKLTKKYTIESPNHQNGYYRDYKQL